MDVPCRSRAKLLARGRVRLARARVTRVAALALLTLCWLAAPANAASITWNGAAGTDLASTGGNWVGGVVPGAGDVAVFNSTSPAAARFDPAFAGSLAGVSISSYSGTITLDRSLSIGASGWVQSSGTASAGANALTITGPFNQTGGTFTASSTTTSVTGNFSRTGGTFQHNSGTLELAGTAAATVSGSTTLGSLSLTTAGKIVSFTAGTEQVVTGAFTVAGAPGTPVTLQSTTAASQWRLTMLGSTSVSDASLQDAGCGSTTQLVPTTATTDAGGNGGCWLFGAVAPVSNLIATPGDAQVALTWQNPTSSDFGLLTIYRSADDSSLGTVVHSTTDTTTTSWTDTALTNGTSYRYRVIASRADGTGATPQVGGVPWYAYGDSAFGPLRWRETASLIDATWTQGIGPTSPLYPGPGQGASYSNRWYGQFHAPYAGSYTMYAMAGTYESATLSVNGAIVAQGSSCMSISACEWSGTVTLAAGWHAIEMTQSEGTMPNWGGRARAAYAGPGITKQTIPPSALGRHPLAEATPASGSFSVSQPAAASVVRGAGSSVTVAWSAASTTPAAATIRFGYSLDDGATVIMVRRSVSDTGTAQWTPPSGLQSTTARVIVEARTSAGRLLRRAMSPQFSIDTRQTTLGDVSGLRATPGDGQVVLAWTNPADAAFDHVNIYRSTTEGVLGTRVAQTSATTWTDSALTNGTTQYYTVRAADASDREAASLEALLDASYYGDLAATSLRWQEPIAGLNATWDAGLGPASTRYPGIAQPINYATRFFGMVNAPTDGLYSFHAVTREYEHVSLLVDGTEVGKVTFCGTTGGCDGAGTIWLHAGWHSIEALHKEDYMVNWGAVMQLSWSGPGIAKQVVPAASLGRAPRVEATPVSGTLSITRPAAGAVVRVDASAAVVEWSAATTPTTSTLRLGYSLDDGATVVWFHRGASNTGSASWTLPSEAWSTTARVVAEARNANGRLLLRSMSGQFTLDTRTTSSVTNVTALEAVGADGQATLTWSDPADAAFDHVNIYRSSTEGQLGTRMAQVAKGVGTWTDATATNGTAWHYTVRAADAADREPAARDPRLSGSYYADDAWTNLRWQEPTQQVNYTWAQGVGPTSGLFPGPAQGASYSSRWYGKVQAPSAGRYEFYGLVDAYESAWVYVDGVLVANGSGCGSISGCEYVGTIGLDPGWHSIEVRHRESSMTNWGARMVVSWRGPGVAKQVIPVGTFGRSPIVDITPAAGTLSVTKPVGGETLKGAGSTTPIEWNASTLTAGSTIRLGYSLDGGASVTWFHRGVTSSTGSWSWAIPGDVASANARIVAEARASNGRVLRRALSGTFSIDTTRATALGNVTGLTAVPGNGSVQLDWTNPASASFDHVNIYRSTVEGVVGTRVAQVAGTSWTDAAATNGTTYHYVVRAADSADRESIPDPRLNGSYYGDTTWGRLRWQEQADQVNFSWASGPISSQAPGVTQATGFSTRWYGMINVATAGQWTFYAAMEAYDGIFLTIDGVPISEGPSCGSIWGCEFAGTAQLAAGWHVVEVRHRRNSSGSGGSLARLSWAGPGVSKQVVPAASLGSWPTVDATPSDSTLALTRPLDAARLGGAPNTESIEWTGASTPAGTIDVRWSLDNGATWRYVARGLATGGPFAWTLPTGVRTTAGAVRVDHLDVNGRMVRTSISRNLDIDTQIAPPTAVTTTDDPSGLIVSWTAGADAVIVDHAVYRATSVDGPWTLLGTTAGTTWTDSSGTPGVTYRYRVRSRDASGRESYEPVSGSLRGSYFHGTNFETARGSQDDTSINFDWGTGSPALVTQADSFSARWTGRIHSPTAGTWSYQLTHDDGVRMYVGGALVLDRWTTCTSCTTELRLALTAGWNDVRLEFHENTGSARFQLRQKAPADASFTVTPGTSLAQEGSVAGSWNPPPWITLTVPEGSSVNLGSVLPGVTVTGATSLDVATNAASGYSLVAAGNTDTTALDGPLGAAFAHRAGGVEPIDWAAADPGFGLAVASATGGKDATRWGSGSSTSNTSGLRYAAPTLTTSVLVHKRVSYSTATDRVVVGYRATLPATQPPGSYSGTITYTATINP